MEEKKEKEYKQKKEGLGLKKYISPLTVTGSAFGAGTAYLVSFPISAARNLFVEQLPNMAVSDVAQGLYNTFEYGSQVGGEFAFLGGVAGLIGTIYARDWVQSLFGIKKR